MRKGPRGNLEVLVFEVGGGRYALALADVVEIQRAVAVAPLPKAPAIIEGVINVRGAVIPVLDIRTRFRLPPKSLDPGDHLIVANAGDRPVAVRADRALDLVNLDATQVEQIAEAVPKAEHVAGVAKLPDGLALIHDLRTFLTGAEAAELDGALEAAS